MINTVRKYIERYRMFPPGCRVIVALSGGADSVCLLRVLDYLKEQLSLRLEAVHVHHGLRGEEADRDAQFSKELCGKCGIFCHVIYCDMNAYAAEHGLSPEEAGRRLRYEAFEKLAGDDGQARIAVAHHLDDDAETILHNMLRGSALKGLGGIAPVRGRIVRPLLCVSREEILQWLEVQRQPYCQDSTNEGNDYTRNRIRNQILPLAVTGVNEQACENIHHAGMMIRQADAYIEKKASEYLEEYGIMEASRFGIGAERLRQQEDIIQSYVLMQMTEKMCGFRKDISSVHIRQIQSLLGKQVGKSCNLPYHLRAVRGYEHVWIERRIPVCTEEVENPHFSVELSIFSHEKGQEFPKKQYTKWFDYDKIKGTLSVRTRRTGDYILLSDGGRKTVKAYMIDQKIPSGERDRIPLLADGSHILWIIGYRISEYYKITDKTDTILQAQYDSKEQKHGGNSDGR